MSGHVESSKALSPRLSMSNNYFSLPALNAISEVGPVLVRVRVD